MRPLMENLSIKNIRIHSGISDIIKKPLALSKSSITVQYSWYKFRISEKKIQMMLKKRTGLELDL